jgi:hypothetical protein
MTAAGTSSACGNANARWFGSMAPLPRSPPRSTTLRCNRRLCVGSGPCVICRWRPIIELAQGGGVKIFSTRAKTRALVNFLRLQN